MKSEPKECNKFKGLVYYAMDSHKEIIAMGSDPDRVRCQAIINGETCPYVFASYKIFNPRLSKLNKLKRLINENREAKGTNS